MATRSDGCSGEDEDDGDHDDADDECCVLCSN